MTFIRTAAVATITATSSGTIFITILSTRWWYRQAVHLGTKMKKYFKQTALERQKGSNQKIADWMDTLESHYQYMLDRGHNVGIVPVPAPRERRGG